MSTELPTKYEPQTLEPAVTARWLTTKAFAALLGCLEFVKRRNQVNQPALGLAIGGIPAVLIAALLVTSLPLDLLRWLVIVVVLYAAFTMIRAAGTPREVR